ncbi:dihydrofolate reductase family protein [Pseudonocardia nigra]|uniref:dihydrofolate reductase family protein n=1 Tax=Pseudonocardia nigra TaxID=1921578 RepID=UPI001FEB7ACD|nr:dihydrofolate reductase family protein [Pseudonocardia nigra]
MGGSRLPATLTGLGLIDEWHIVVHPVVLGGGKPLFRSPQERIGMELVESRAFDGGSVLLRYRRRPA